MQNTAIPQMSSIPAQTVRMHSLSPAFLPQYQGDHETIARQTLSGLKANLETLEGLDRQMQELKRK